MTEWDSPKPKRPPRRAAVVIKLKAQAGGAVSVNESISAGALTAPAIGDFPSAYSLTIDNADR